MIGAAGAKFREAGGILGVDEAQDPFVVLHRADPPALLAHLSSEPGQNSRQPLVANFLRQALVLGATEGSRVASLGLILRFNEGRRLFDVFEGGEVALLVVLIPGDESVLSHHNGLGLGVFAADLLHRQSQFKTGAHPGDVIHGVPEDFPRQFHAAARGGNGDDCVGVHVIDKTPRDEAVQGGVDRRGARVEIEGGVGIHGHHVVFGGGLQALVRAGGIHRLKADETLLIE